MKKALPIGNDQFQKIIQNNMYYVDKTLMIKDFIEYQDTVALITRPRRFGKTINMTMIREFFDITKNNKALFQGLAIMDTEYASLINSCPVIYFSFKDCTGRIEEELRKNLIAELLHEYVKYAAVFDVLMDKTDGYVEIFYRTLESLKTGTLEFVDMMTAIEYLIRTVHDCYKIPPILLIDEYDQPILSSYEHHYKDTMGEFFASFYGRALKGNEYLGQALLTGIQRVAKESVFSRLNNIKVYTVLQDKYSTYFGLTSEECSQILTYYSLTLNDAVKIKYNGYKFGSQEIYNPWSILMYAEEGKFNNYWVNTSTNYLVRKALSDADEFFQRKFEQLLTEEAIEVGATLETSFIELQNNYSLWGLLVNSGYLTALEQIDESLLLVRIPNSEVQSEFQKLVAEQAHIENEDLQTMFRCLMDKNIEQFIEMYSQIVLSCTSFFDARENAYHMLFLGMCITLRGKYRVTSNLETGLGRSDITLEALSKYSTHVIIEFKQGNNIEQLKQQALKQILDQKYFATLTGEILCVGIAHNGKRCEAVSAVVNRQ